MSASPLPKGQRAISNFPRFGLSAFANRFPRSPNELTIELLGHVKNETPLNAEQLVALPRVNQVSDFHCVTTWTYQDANWSGYRFRDVYDHLIEPLAQPAEEAVQVLLKGQDGYRSSLPLNDLLAENVLLADRLNNEPLTIEHGAPLRLVAPKHYGYKNVKHLCSIEFLLASDTYKPAALQAMDHPRARVDFEERGRGFPGLFYRLLYRPLVEPTISKFAKAMRRGGGEA